MQNIHLKFWGGRCCKTTGETSVVCRALQQSFNPLRSKLVFHIKMQVLIWTRFGFMKQTLREN